ncbi:low specificity L-threonine aldolase [Motiliproteus coralliicola]|uniref:L-threonine aldolase n=1 Tax=Motiliproteus coralliicola TaxID=2283196 RepID=A0A369WEK0_9GAMM|nr:low specificity L-threonine aldolase [Motiliproteus coralliicola]RDE19723.1 low specificity L-threonine aldolase [Motiliproteus coralliicola]
MNTQAVSIPESTPTSTPILQQRGFTSDNIAPASEQVIEAISRANSGQAKPYGVDPISQQVEQQLREIFECELEVMLVPTGSAANAIGLSVLTPPWGQVFCHPDSHINNDECGAPEFYTNGAKLVPVDGDDARIDPAQLAPLLQRMVGDVHSTQPAVVSITQATETGSLYSLEQIQQIGQLCSDAGVRLHMDGARFANALAALDCSPAEMTWKAGVDVLSFGATKNGTLAAEAIILFDPSLATELGYRRKRGGHLCSKMRFMSAQMQAYLAEDLWLDNARNANAMAARLAEGLRGIDGVELQGQPEANIIFCRLPQTTIEALLDQGFGFYHDRWAPGIVRLVTNFATRADEVDALINAVQTLQQRQIG